MPIKDITNEEKSNLYMIGRKPKEPTKITESERATYNTVLPLDYYDLLSDQIAAKDDGFSEYSSAANNFFNNEVQNPNIYNKHNSFPLTMVTKMSQKEQDEILEIITNNVEKLHWDPVEIARHMKIELDKKMGCIWHVIVGEEFAFEITYEGAMSYVYYGSLAILMWKCGTQLMSEIVYKPIHEEEDLTKVMKKPKFGTRVFK